MTWELVAQITIIMFMATVFIVLIMAIASAIADGRAKREIMLREAGIDTRERRHRGK